MFGYNDLRPYQQKAVGTLSKLASEKRSVIECLATGGGKTFEFCYIAQSAIARGGNVLILTDRMLLLSQTVSSLKKFGLHPSYIVAGQKNIPKNSLHIASSQTLKRRLVETHKDYNKYLGMVNSKTLILIDECHKQEFDYIFTNPEIDPKIIKLGFSATPFRSGKMRQLGLNYRDIHFNHQPQALIELGMLVPSIPVVAKLQTDFSGVRWDGKNGDYKVSDIFSKFNKSELYDGIVEAYKEYGQNRTHINYCSNQEHAIKTCLAFNKAGIPYKFFISGYSKPKELKADATHAERIRHEEKERLYSLYMQYYKQYSGDKQQMLDELEQGKIRGLSNVDILTTGIDIPNLGGIIYNSKTLSLTKWLQALGRGSRTFKDKKNFFVIDASNNFNTLGAYESTRNYNLWHNEGKGGGDVILKQCGFANGNPKRDKNENLGCGYKVHTSVMICPECGYSFYSEKELKEMQFEERFFDPEKNGLIAIKDMSLEKLAEFREAKRYNVGWLIKQIQTRDEDVYESLLKLGYNKYSINTLKDIFHF